MQTANATTAELQTAMRTATFEVVMKKPEKDPLTYEKPLPLELLPYMERTDKYRSVGTAFSLGHNTYVTAGHVLNAGINSQFGLPALRDADGKVYAIDQIIKYSAHEDFAVFSVVGDPAPNGLAVNRTPHINDSVFAVGNALGDGVVIRDGLYTSNTPEEQDGRWKWIRFSAPASPGNSGGPLVDVSGAVIGIVIGKSPNENLNYSLPITIVLDASTNKATFDTRYLQSLPYLHGTLTHSLKADFPLPKKWSAFETAYLALTEHDVQQSRDDLLAKNASTYFPIGADEILYDTDHKYNPQMIVQQPDARWISESPRFENTDLPGDGFIKVGTINNVTLFRLHRPDQASDGAFYHDSKAFIDMALKGLDITRQVGSDSVRVTSLGLALRDDKITDKYGRIWQRRVWPLPYLDSYVMAMILPTPDGYDGFFQYGASPTLNGMTSLAENYANLIDMSYWGTIAQWQSFLKQRDLVPEPLAHLQLNGSGSSLKISSSRVALNAISTVMRLDNNSLLGMDMNYARDAKQLTWNIGSLWLFTDLQRRAYIAITRHTKPPSTMKHEYQDDWNNMINRRSPYDGAMSRETAQTWSATTIIPVASTTAGKTSDALMYSLKVAVENFIPPEQMNDKLKTVREAVQVAERGEGVLSVDQLSMTQQVEKLGTLQREFDVLKQILSDMSDKFADKVTDTTMDDRGRTQADDLRQDLVTEETRIRINTIADAFDKAVMIDNDADKAEVQMDALKSINDMLRDRYVAISRYWDNFRETEREQTLWQHALELDHLPADTPHDKSVALATAKLHNITSISTEFNDAKIAALHQLVDTMITDRNALARRIGSDKTRDALIQYNARQTACPDVASADEGTTTHIAKPETHRDGQSTSNAMTPAKLHGTAPDIDDYYPQQSQNIGEQGVVVLSLKIDVTGCPLSVGVGGSSGSDALDTAALKFVELLNYYPATLNGNPVPATQPVAINFKLGNRSSNK